MDPDPLPLDTLFDLSGIITASPYPRRLAQMHFVYGQHPTAHCRDCAHLLTRAAGSQTVRKCTLFADTRSAATDWRLFWPACGAFSPTVQDSPP